MKALGSQDASALYWNAAFAEHLHADLCCLAPTEDVVLKVEQIDDVVRGHHAEIDRRAELAQRVCDASRAGVRVI